ncbi:MAG: hypothetical protein GDA53_02815 [Rhodobacteraceae bacterium]|nr:hypothetical protein [Paracoccaceae bacterium]
MPDDPAVLTTATRAALAAGASGREVTGTIMQMATVGAAGVGKAMPVVVGVLVTAAAH